MELRLVIEAYTWLQDRYMVDIEAGVGRRNTMDQSSGWVLALHIRRQVWNEGCI